jgi:hypothetical protein
MVRLNAWGLSGTEGTSSASNFIGTMDDQALVFKVNGQKAGRLDHIDANVFFGGKQRSESGQWSEQYTDR